MNKLSHWTGLTHHTQQTPLAHGTLTSLSESTAMSPPFCRENPLIHLNYAILLHNNGETRAAAKQLQLFKSKSQTHTESNTDPEVTVYHMHVYNQPYVWLNFILVRGIQLELYVYTIDRGSGRETGSCLTSWGPEGEEGEGREGWETEKGRERRALGRTR